MLLSKTNLDSIHVTEKYTVRGTLAEMFCIEPDKTVVTDGKVLFEVQNLHPELEEQFPEVEGHDNGLPAPKDRALLSLDSVEAILKNIPKKVKRTPILENARITFAKTYATVSTTNLEQGNVAVMQLLDRDFPNAEARKEACPSGEPILEIGISAERLGRILSFASKHTMVDTVKLSFYGANEAVKITPVCAKEQDWTALLMPIRLNEAVEESEAHDKD